MTLTSVLFSACWCIDLQENLIIFNNSKIEIRIVSATPKLNLFHANSQNTKEPLTVDTNSILILELLLPILQAKTPSEVKR